MQGAYCSCQKEKKAEKGIEIDLSQILIFYSNSFSEFIYAIVSDYNSDSSDKMADDDIYSKNPLNFNVDTDRPL